MKPNQIFEKIKLKTEDVFDMIEFYDSYRDLYPNYSDQENEYEEDYFFPTKEEAYENINETLGFLTICQTPLLYTGQSK